MPPSRSPVAKPLNLAIVGATGAVGREMLSVLAQRAFPIASLKLLASARSAGSVIEFGGRSHTVGDAEKESFADVDVALMSPGASVSKRLAPIAVKAGAVVIDNSSAFRMDPAVPLVIPEVNAAALPARSSGGCIISVPNCSAIIMLMALTPLQRAFGVERIVVSTYQAVSGAGAAAMDELASQARSVLSGGAATPKVFHEPCAFNVFSHNAAMDPVSGLNGEEAKMIAETRKIWNDPNVRISATCVRVPVMRAHCESINVTLATPATLDDVRAAIAEFPGVRIVDDRAANRFPTPLAASGGDVVLVGRLREDPSQTPARFAPGAPTLGFDLFVAGDQLRKGAALNAVQIAEAMFAG